jgi:hypothetical protein
MVDLPQPEGPTSATNDPSGMRRLVSARSGTEFAPTPKLTQAFESSIASAGAPSRPAPVESGAAVTGKGGGWMLMQKCRQPRCHGLCCGWFRH